MTTAIANRRRFVPAAAALVAACLALGGCNGPPEYLVDAADRMANRTVLPEYEALVREGYGARFDGEADRYIVVDDLSQSEIQARLDNATSFRDAANAAVLERSKR